MRGSIAALAIGVLLAGGCGRGGDGGAPTPAAEAPPAQVAGLWSRPEPLNAGEARFTECTGDAVGLNGVEVGDLLDGCTLGPLRATQSGDTFSLGPTPYACTDGRRGSRGALTGGGTISGSRVEGEFTARDDDGAAETVFFTGSVSGDQLTIDQVRAVFSGRGSGSCALSPPLAATVTIVGR